ncbi:hypothetical protein QQ008_17915 [Fulvivirgaceae bacterium BMA10]|uniref:Tetratricopeptide repeat protein n=1 Tax=Splendidivirga corallicola TaxID=3051826 RepID=A0ABT8KR90_9BACT|nr:hypothetical protein [Fulvivirgaceae bacterium BMA10]
MKNKLFYTLVFISIAFVQQVSGQSEVKNSEEYKHHKSIYDRAVRYSDIGVAKNAIYNLLVLDPNDVSLLDSLAILYFDYNQYAQSLLVSLDILKKNPNSLVATEISAVSYENLQLYDKALTSYESLYLKNNNIYTLYKIAFLQFNLKRYNEARTSTDIILKDKKSEELNIVFNPSRNKQEEVSMKAAVLNLKGLIAKEEGNKDEAKKLFEEALVSAPEFTFAKQNIEDLEK